MRIAISAESTCDLSKELIEQYDVKIIPYHIVLGDKTFTDGEISTTEMFALADQTGTLPKTSAINEFEYEAYFAKLKQEYDAVIHISLSSKLTTSTANAIKAAKNFKDIYVIDSRSLSTGIALLVRYARILIDRGEDVKEIVRKVEKRKESLQVSFVIERLDYLYKGGRCNSLQYYGANLLRLRPRIIMQDGAMHADKKYRGSMGHVVESYCRDILEEFCAPDFDCVFITYTTATAEMVAAARLACKEAGFKNIYETQAGGTIASHCGAHTLGILYFNDYLDNEGN